MISKNLIEETHSYCKSLIKNSICSTYPFHNWKHTKEVVTNSKRIAEGENLSNDEKTTLIIASYFHDTGHIFGTFHHEKKSATLAEEFLKQYTVTEKFIDEVTETIYATALNTIPLNKLQMVIRDADLAHLGQKCFDKKNRNLRKEWAVNEGINYSEKEWLEANIVFLQSHRFFTNSANLQFNYQKQLNIKSLENKLKDI
ncbi:HD domain-containing protein [Leeuwenhoekiella sp. MAR_2009_132]|uniref:HD domain-containing protein n=1 Tax=Leeuwenhoekiella sp. MAR_2009_132 TaxID=1392489 RepID=UPI000491CBDF|nr:HD domain-containing protein [Leeuwenhoekiella sp. MAR_2009_132]